MVSISDEQYEAELRLRATLAKHAARWEALEKRHAVVAQSGDHSAWNKYSAAIVCRYFAARAGPLFTEKN